MIPPTTLFATAAAVGALHMSAPDHWVTLCIMARASRWSRSKLIGLGVATAIGHVAISVALGFGIVGVGLLVSGAAYAALMLVTGGVMVVGGLAYALRSTVLRREPPEGSVGTRSTSITYFAVLGAALSPDLAVLPVFVLAVPAGLAIAVDTALAFSAASVLSLIAFLLLGSSSLERVLSRIPERYNDGLVGVVVAIVGVYVILFG